MTTPLYGLPSPSLTTGADGPAAFAALASRTERELPTLRSQAWYESENAQGMGLSSGGAWTNIINATTTVTAIGWADFELTAFIRSQTGQVIGQFIAGQIRCLVNNAVIAEKRWHNYGVTLGGYHTFSGSVALQSGVTTLNTNLQIIADDASSGALTEYGRIMVRQYGAPASG